MAIPTGPITEDEATTDVIAAARELVETFIGDRDRVGSMVAESIEARMPGTVDAIYRLERQLERLRFYGGGQ